MINRIGLQDKYGVTRTPKVLDDFTTISDWAGGAFTKTADTVYFKEGSQSLKASGVVDGSRMERINISPSWDFSEGGVIKIRVFCVALLSSSSLRLRLSRIATGVTGDNITFVWNRTSLQDGWNELVIHTDEPDPTIWHEMNLGWVGSGTTVDFSVPMQSCAIALFGSTGVTEFYVDSIEFQARSRAKMILGFDAAGADITDGATSALTIMANSGMNGYIAAEGSYAAITPGNNYGSPDSLARLHKAYDAGWDIIGHSETHADLSSLATAQDIIDEIQPNMDAMIGEGFTRDDCNLHFAYPVNGTNKLAVDTLISLGVITARSANSRLLATSKYGFLNPLWHGSTTLDDALLPSIKLYVDSVVKYGTTGNIYGHTLIAGPSGGTGFNVDDFQSLVDYMASYVRSGQLDVVTSTGFYKDLTDHKRTG